jgi:hypothetical protein
MGSEVLPNQAAIDRACVAEARTDVVLAVIAGVAGLAAAVYAVLLSRRTRVRRGSGRPSCSTGTAATCMSGRDRQRSVMVRWDTWGARWFDDAVDD